MLNARPRRATCVQRIEAGGPSRHAAQKPEMARAGIEPATPRFSAVCSTN